MKEAKIVEYNNDILKCVEKIKNVYTDYAKNL